MLNLVNKLFGSSFSRRLKSYKKIVDNINNLESSIKLLSDSELKKKTDEFREKINNGFSLDEILPEAFAVVRETSKRTIQQRHFDVQLIGGIVLHKGMIAEMKTGEGKTLVATLPIYLNALTGLGVHVVTVNDYLAKRDSEWMGPLFEFHGLKVDCIDKHDPNSKERKNAYKADVTYGTNNEFGFDYLRDNMAKKPDALVQRKHHFSIVDEVDSVLIDDARIPLIISGPTPRGDVHEFNELKHKIEQL